MLLVLAAFLWLKFTKHEHTLLGWREREAGNSGTKEG